MRILPKIEQMNERQQVAFSSNAMNGYFSNDENEYEEKTVKMSPLERINELNKLNGLRSYFVSIASDDYRKSYSPPNTVKLKLNSLKELLLSFLN